MNSQDHYFVDKFEKSVRFYFSQTEYKMKAAYKLKGKETDAALGETSCW